MSSEKCLLLSVRADIGGGPEHIHLLLRGLSNRYQFFVAAPFGQSYSQRFAKLSILHDLPFRKFSPLTFFQLVLLIRRERISLIHSHGKGAGIYGRLLGIITNRPVIHTFHGFHYRHLPSLKRRLYLSLERWLTSHTRVLLNVSASERKSCIEAGILSGQGKSVVSVVVPNGVVVPPIWTNPLARPRRRKFVLINVARHEPEKGVDKVVQVAHELAKQGIDFELWLVGDGEQSPAIKEQVRAAGLSEKISFMGFRDDVSQLLHSADLFVSASHGEGMPLTLLEAMAAGLPSVASDVIGNCDVVENGETGFLFPLDQPETAAQMIARLMNDSSLYTHCSRSAHARALESYSVEVMCDRIGDVYENVISNK